MLPMNDDLAELVDKDFELYLSENSHPEMSFRLDKLHIIDYSTMIRDYLAAKRTWNIKIQEELKSILSLAMKSKDQYLKLAKNELRYIKDGSRVHSHLVKNSRPTLFMDPYSKLSILRSQFLIVIAIICIMFYMLLSLMKKGKTLFWNHVFCYPQTIQMRIKQSEMYWKYSMCQFSD